MLDVLDMPNGTKPYSMKLSRKSKRELKIPDLLSSMRNSLQVMKRYRENYKKMIRLVATAEWSDNAADMRRPWNGLGLYLQIVSRFLVNQNPRALLSTWRTEFQREVWTAQEWGNKQFKKMRLGDHIHRCVNDGLLWMGIMKTGITDPITSHNLGFKIWAGEVYSQSVSPDDYVADVFANNFDSMKYEGHRFRGDVDIANRQFNLRGDNKLEGSNSSTFNNEGDERAAVIGRGYQGGDYDEFGDAHDFWEVHVKAHNAVLTFRSQNGGVPAGEDDLVDAVEYIGPYCGQYTKFAYEPVPSQLFPKGPAMNLLPLDQSINQQLRKTLRQAENMKEQTWYSSSAADDMKRIREAGDGSTVMVNRIQEIIQRTMGEPNPRLLMVTAQMMQLFNKIAGNLDTLGGLSKMAGTARQEEIINSNAAGSVSFLQTTTVGAVTELMDNIFWYWWHDPTGQMHATYKGIRADPTLSVERVVGPEDRQKVPWEDIEAIVDPYSLSAQTPQSKLQHLRALVQTSIPMMQFLQQQGIALDATFWLNKEGEYANNPDIPRLFRLQDPPPGSTPQSSHDQTKSPVTQRTQIRRNESEATDEGMQDDLIQKLMGAGMNPNQGADTGEE